MMGRKDFVGVAAGIFAAGAAYHWRSLTPSAQAEREWFSFS
jgi:hypothetical protein